MLEFVRVDIGRAISRKNKSLLNVGVILFNLGLHAVLLYRISRWFYVHRMRSFAVFVSYFSSVLTGAQISPRATIGKGLAIYHPQGTVIGGTAILGENCTLIHNNVIGQIYGDEDRPVIGDNFYAGTGAKILGQIKIGNHVRVGANAVVVSSLPDRAIIAAPQPRVIVTADSRPRTGNGDGMSREAIVQHLVVLLKRNFEILASVDSMEESTGLLGQGIGLDSIEVLNLVGAIEEEFAITVDDSELETSNFETIGSLATWIQESLHADE